MTTPESYLSLSEVQAELAVVSVTAAHLERLGFIAIDGATLAKKTDDHVLAKKLRSSKVYRASEVPRIKAAIARRMNCDSGESYFIGDLLLHAPETLPSGHSLTLQVSPAGHSLSLQYPDGKTCPVNCTPPLSRCIKSAIDCAQADAAIKQEQEESTSTAHQS